MTPVKLRQAVEPDERSEDSERLELEISATASYRAAIRAFGDVAVALGKDKDLDTLLHLIAVRICELTDVRRCSIYLRDETTGLFHGQVGHAALDIDARVKRLTAGVAADGFTREIVETKRPVLISNTRTDPRPIRATMRAWKILAMLGVPMILKGEVIGIVFLDNEEQPHSFTPGVREIASTFADLAAVAIAQAQITTQVRQSLHTVARQNDLLRRAAVLDDRLAELTLKGADVREIGDAVADLTNKPTAIYDASYTRRALAMPSWIEGEITPQLLEAPHRDDPAVQEALAALSESRPSVIGPLPSAGLHHRFLVAPVTVRESLWGYVVIMEYGRRFGALDTHIARRAATNVALELSAEQRAAMAEWDARSALASELIRGAQDEVMLQRRADFLGVDLDARHLLCLITADELDPSAIPSPHDVAAIVGEVTECEDVLAAAVAEGVVVIVALPEGESPSASGAAVGELVGRSLTRLANGGRLIGSLSRPCSSVGDFAGAYVEVCQVMRCQRSFGTPECTPVVAASDLGAGRLFLASADRTEADRFARESLDGIRGEDETSRELMRTLCVFFEQSFSVRKSAGALDVHENTVRYRLSRIQEATGLDVVGDSDDRLTAQLSLMILKLGGRIAEHERASAPDVLPARSKAG
ncbi:MAG TPA: GAF domain-containing protein [Solirubrobacteraceae bacterium]|jgi:GAF domain-containing protein|nr:GAF domain-containing protein [Solirubrobacteraceae bacterium]